MVPDDRSNAWPGASADSDRWNRAGLGCPGEPRARTFTALTRSEFALRVSEPVGQDLLWHLEAGQRDDVIEALERASRSRCHASRRGRSCSARKLGACEAVDGRTHACAARTRSGGGLVGEGRRQCDCGGGSRPLRRRGRGRGSMGGAVEGLLQDSVTSAGGSVLLVLVCKAEDCLGLGLGLRTGLECPDDGFPIQESLLVVLAVVPEQRSNGCVHLHAPDTASTTPAHICGLAL